MKSGSAVLNICFINKYSLPKVIQINLFYLGMSSGKTSGKRVNEIVASLKRDEIRGVGDHHLEMVPLKIPSLPPTMSSCSCIKISYEVKVILFVSNMIASWHQNFEQQGVR